MALAKALVELVGEDGAFVSDGFGVVHRKQASVYDVATLLPHYAGTLVAAEVKVLEQLTSSTERPYAVVLGGSKVSDKLAVIENLAGKADSVIIGGGMCFTFLAAQGLSVGTSLLQEEMLETCRRHLLDEYGDVIHLPVDIVVAEEFAADSPPETVAADRIPDGRMGLDIGPESVKRFATLLSNARTIFWNGPMGVFEFPAFADGTRGGRSHHRRHRQGCVQRRRWWRLRILRCAGSVCRGRFLAHFHRRRRPLEYLEGKSLPGIEVLNWNSARCSSPERLITVSVNR